MSQIHRLFLTIEGDNDAYPNYKSAKVHLSVEDPAMLRYDNLFITSPLFSLNLDGVSEIPKLDSNTKITFLMVGVKFPAFNDISNQIGKTNAVWYTIGLANLVIIDNSEKHILTSEVVSELESKNLITALESWQLDKDHISLDNQPVTRIYTKAKEVYHCEAKISDLLPSSIKFAVSEFIISVDKFLTASKKFTPYYFDRHDKTVKAALDLISDISFLHGDEDYLPSEALISNLGVKTAEELKKLKTSQNDFMQLVDQLINDWHGKIIQFNSSLSYIYSQAYSGTFPIFDHIGIVRRHSLLGLGSAVGALYELLMQLEQSLYYLPFEDLTTSLYNDLKCPASYLELIIDPTLFESTLWTHDQAKQKVTTKEVGSVHKPVALDFFHRLSFFSGRLGFREYEFSATSAIQVLVEGHRLPWHVINYTHEIIHNHVRLILNHLLIAIAPRQKTPNEEIAKYTDIIESILGNDENPEITYYDYFVTILLKFVVNANIFGSLTAPANAAKIGECQGSTAKRMDYMLPDEKDLQEHMLLYYKDVTEIFVHIIDYNYIYKQQEEVYMMSIWASWSTIPAVVNDIKQYILRSLIIIGLRLDGTIDIRFDAVVLRFKQLLEELKSHHSNVMHDRILEIIKDVDDLEDLRYRFYNCMIIGDLVNTFFVGKLEALLDNEDRNIMPNDNTDEQNVPKLYYIDRNSFEGQPIKSKVRFLLDQLINEIYKGKDESDELTERTCAWLLLSLSSIQND